MTEASLAVIGATDPFKGAVKSAGLRALPFAICRALRAAQPSSDVIMSLP